FSMTCEQTVMMLSDEDLCLYGERFWLPRTDFWEIELRADYIYGLSLFRVLRPTSRPAFTNPTWMTTLSTELFVTDRYHWRDIRCASGRQISGGKYHYRKYRQSCCEHPWVAS